MAADGTVDDLTRVAERLFARCGVENVALTQIVAEAGHRNRSALHYHFGSRAGVLTAVLDRRLGPINARREALIDALPPGASATEIVRAEIAPLGRVIVEEPWGADYLSILAQVTFHPQLLGERAIDEARLSGLRRGRLLLNALALHLPAALLTQRLTWLRDSVVFALARWARDNPEPARHAAALDALLDHLAAYGAAGLIAPAPVLPADPEPKP